MNDYVVAGLTGVAKTNELLLNSANLASGEAAEGAAIFGIELGVTSHVINFPSIVSGVIGLADTGSSYVDALNAQSPAQANAAYTAAANKGGGALGAVAGAELFGFAFSWTGPAAPVFAVGGAIAGTYAGSTTMNAIQNFGYTGLFNFFSAVNNANYNQPVAPFSTIPFPGH